MNHGSPHRKKRPTHDSLPSFAAALTKHPPPLPPILLRRLGSKELSGLGKVKVMLKVSEPLPPDSPLTVDPRRRQVTLVDPSGSSSITPEDRRLGVSAPKMFAFDAIFTDQEPKTEICSSALTDIIHAVINGTDGCLFTFGHPRLGKTNTMVGSAETVGTLGVIPSAISWLYKCIGEMKPRTGARFSVRVSAVEVSGASHSLRDLLAQHASESDGSPNLYLCEGSLGSCCELRAPSPEAAGFYLDSALQGRSSDQSHLFYTLHLYQYSVAGKGGVAGGRSRLHLVDLGSCDRTKASGGLAMSAIGNVLLAIFNGQKHLPHREHRLTQQLKECMGSLTCHAAMIAHVSPLAPNFSETLSTIQLASRIHRMRRKRFKFMSTSGNPGGGEDAGRPAGSSDVDPSSSEQSADTVIYVGPTEETDGEHPPVYIPSLNSGDNRCAMNKALRGSLVEQKLKTISKSVPASPQKSLVGDDKLCPRKAPKPVVSTRSSPVRRPPEEHWVDGPRVLRSRVNEGRNIHRGREKRETWVDGPRSSGGYGFMDTHKKNMIRRWVEVQSALSTKPRPQAPREEPLPSLSRVVPLERLQCTKVETEYEDDEEMEVEIIEVEEPAEPVPMQDCCLQVTEEDIALCMGEIENPLPEVDQDEHPLRILSQENLTVVSTLADSLSVANDLEKLFPRNVSLVRGMNGWHHNRDTASDLISRRMSQYEEMRALQQELYDSGMEPLQRDSLMRPVSRCQSLMFAELISGAPLSSDFDVNSIASEPAYLPRENGKFCDNCKVNIEDNDDVKGWQKQDITRFHSFRKFTSISSLRHPDGASNPNLRDLCTREPGNGAEAEEGDEEEVGPVPPPLQQSNLYTLARDPASYTTATPSPGYENLKSRYKDHQELNNVHLHDPGGKGQYCRADVEKLDRGWDETLKNGRAHGGGDLKTSSREQHKFVKAELASARHRLFSPFGHGGLFEKRKQFPNNTSTSKNTKKTQAV